MISKRGPKQNNRKNFAAREAFLLYRKKRNKKKLNPQRTRKLSEQ